jgi:hypothetical protein
MVAQALPSLGMVDLSQSEELAKEESTARKISIAATRPCQQKWWKRMMPTSLSMTSLSAMMAMSMPQAAEGFALGTMVQMYLSF